MNESCPCGTGRDYSKCCGPFHRGELPKTALELMRSRYSAYALGVIDYIIETTHPLHHDWGQDREAWKKQLLAFSTNTDFERLEILGAEEGSEVGFVTFTAHLRQAGQDRTFTERSRFEKLKGRWLYLSGSIF